MSAKRSNAGVFVVCALVIGFAGTLPCGAQQAGDAPQSLSLKAFLDQVVRTNPSVEEGWLQWLIKSRDARAAWGTFEPTLVGSYKESGLVQQNTALQQYQQLGTSIYDESNGVYSLGIQGKVPTGAVYNAGTSVTRLQDTYVEAGQYQSFVGVSAQQPLLKGATHGAPTAAIHAAFADRIIAFHQYRKQLMSMIAQAETAYWNLAFAQEAERMAADSVRVARYLLNVAQQGAGIGRMSQLDVEQARAELASRLATHDDSELSVRDAQTSLRLLLGSAGAAVKSGIVAGDPLVEGGGAELDPSELLAWANRAQPDYMIALENERREQVLVGFQKDQALPELNLTGSYGYTGLGSTVQDSLSSLQSQSYPTWSVGLEMKLPLLLGVEQRNNVRSEELKLNLAQVRLKAAEDQMTRAIENLARDAETLRRRITNAKTLSDVKKQLLDVETARLNAGSASIVDVYNAEDALDQARQHELQSVAQYRTALLQLRVASGSVLKDEGFEKLVAGEVVLSDELRSRER